MTTIKRNTTGPLLAMAAAALVTASGSPTMAGKGGSAQTLQQAIQSGSVDALSAELERTERLVCASCVQMVRPLIDHPDGRVRRVATWWLARRGLKRELFLEMVGRLAQPDSQRALHAADVLGSLRSHQAITPLGAALNNPVFDGPSRVAMAAALGRIGEPAAAPSLLEAAGAPEPLVRTAAVAALRELRGPIDLRALVPRLEDADAGVRGEVVYTLGATRGRNLDGPTRTAITTGLVRRLAGDPQAVVRRRAAWALGEISAPPDLAAAPLESARSKDSDSGVRSLASAAFSRLPK